MRVFNIANELAPYTNGTGLGAEVAALLDAFVGRGHEVHAVAPVGGGARLEGFSLARRLKPIAIDLRGRDVRFTRFEGRTTSGVNVNLLQPGEGTTPEALLEAFPRAAAEVVRTMGGQGGACLSWKREGISVDPIDAGSAEPSGVPRVLALPVVVDAHPRLGRVEKASAKAGLQAAFGLPVRAGAPLAFFGPMREELRAHVLADYLRGDVQAVAAAPSEPEGGPLAALAARYPERLTLVPDETPADALLAGADLCVSSESPRLCARAMSFGAVPVAVDGSAGGAVDLEPSLESGAAFLAGDDSAAGLLSALGRAVSAFRSGPAFAALSSRIQSYPLDWDAFAARIEQLIPTP
jgi:hypothetical protein